MSGVGDSDSTVCGGGGGAVRPAILSIMSDMGVNQVSAGSVSGRGVDVYIPVRVLQELR